MSVWRIGAPEFTEEDKNWSREVASHVDLPEADGEFDNEVTKPMEDRVVKIMDPAIFQM